MLLGIALMQDVGKESGVHGRARTKQVSYEQGAHVPGLGGPGVRGQAERTRGRRWVVTHARGEREKREMRGLRNG
jgi:hypothetical protein